MPSQSGEEISSGYGTIFSELNLVELHSLKAKYSVLNLTRQIQSRQLYSWLSASYIT